jgi:hypothetical protein
MRQILICLIAMFVLGPMATARAAPRDEVMTSLFRCNAIGDDRQWLDCFYGAAQPVREELALKPVPSFQLALVQRPPAGGMSLSPQARGQAVAEAGRCYADPNDRAWLACYYAAASPLRQALKLPSAPTAPRQGSSPVVASVAPAGNGVIRARMASYLFDGQKFFTVTLSNGQVWRQLDGDTATAHWNKPAPSYMVAIKPGMFGSHNFSVDGTSGVFRVRQVR